MTPLFFISRVLIFSIKRLIYLTKSMLFVIILDRFIRRETGFPSNTESEIL